MPISIPQWCDQNKAYGVQASPSFEYFNSSMVRLESASCTSGGTNSMGFQFLNGAIRIVDTGRINENPIRFQFLNGAIRIVNVY